jgi:hypothetical protein
MADDTVSDTDRETPLRFAEILAASSIPDFAALPLELWPGYHSRATTTESEDDAQRTVQPRAVNLND